MPGWTNEDFAMIYGALSNCRGYISAMANKDLPGSSQVAKEWQGCESVLLDDIDEAKKRLNVIVHAVS